MPESSRSRWWRVLLVVVAVLALAGAGIGTAFTLRSDADRAGALVVPNEPPVLKALPFPGPVLEADDGGPRPSPAGVAAALGPALANPQLGSLSGEVVDVETGTVLLAREPTRLMVPASTAKIVTALAVLDSLPPDHRFDTRVVEGTVSGEIVLVGGGDPTLSASAPGKPTTYQGAARLAELAEALRDSATRVTRVLVDTSLFAGPTVHQGWDVRDVPSGYVAPITALMVDGGRVRPDKPARTNEPHLDAGRKFAALLGLPPTAVTIGAASRDARTLAEVSSPPVTRLVEMMLATSDNVLAETLARQVAVALGQRPDFGGAADAVRGVAAALGVDISTEKLVDGSGLSPTNRLSAGLLTDLLLVAAEPEHPELHALYPGLPVAGYDGTLAGRYRTAPTATSAGMVRAKTGTLTGVSSLAGIVEDADGRLLAFAFIANGLPPGGSTSAAHALDAVTTALSRCGCT